MPGRGRSRHGGRVTQQVLAGGGGTRRSRRGGRLSAGRIVRSRGAWELGLVLVLYVAYSASRLLANGSMGPAVERAGELLHLERLLLLDWESSLNELFVEVRAVGVFGSFWYATAHYVVTAVVLVWLYRQGAVRYVPARRALVAATLLALTVYLLMPTAPPRLSPGFVDVLELHSAQGWWGGDASAPKGLGGLTNQLAALPSLHAGWALWVAVMLQRHARPPWRLLGWLHAGITAVVVVGTGNHWVLDVVTGWAVVVLGFAVVRFASTALPGPVEMHSPRPVDPAEVHLRRG